jgi:hypothetical protein
MRAPQIGARAYPGLFFRASSASERVVPREDAYSPPLSLQSSRRPDAVIVPSPAIGLRASRSLRPSFWTTKRKFHFLHRLIIPAPQ